MPENFLGFSVTNPFIYNENLYVEFSDSNHYQPIQLKPNAQSVENLIKSPNGHPFWIVTFIDENGQIQINNQVKTEISYQHVRNTLILNWHNIIFGKDKEFKVSVSVLVNLQPGDETASIKLNVKNHDYSASLALWNIEVYLPELVFQESDQVFYPYSFGVVMPKVYFDNNPSYQGIYPSGEASMQHMAIGGSQKFGAYFAAHDPLASMKTFITLYVKDQDTQNLGVQWVPENASLQFDTYRQPFPLALGVFKMPLDKQTFWYDASQIYKNWVLKEALWTSKGGIRDRKQEFPDWFIDNNLWINSGWQCLDRFNDTEGKPDVVVKRSIDFKNRLGVDSLGLHWYEFQQGPNPAPEARYKFDTHYPDYFLPREGFEEAVEVLSDQNIHVFPYINGRIFDIKSDSYLNENGSNYVVQNVQDKFGSKNLTAPIEEYGSDAVFTVADPSQQYWQQKYAEVVLNLTKYKVQGIYIDQLGAAHPRPDFNPKHGHPFGGGHWWNQGINEMVLEIQKKIEKETYLLPLITESNAENTIGPLQGLLTLTAFFPPYHGIETNEVGVSAFPFIYGGYYIGIGSIFNQGDMLQNDIICSKVSQQFAFGVQFGWFSMGGVDFGPDLDKQCGKMGTYELFMSQEFDFLIQFMQKLISIRQQYIDYFVYGYQYRTGVLNPPSQGVKYDTEKYGPTVNQGPYPLITTSVWINEKQNKLAIFVISNTQQGYKGNYTILVEGKFIKFDVNIQGRDIQTFEYSL